MTFRAGNTAVNPALPFITIRYVIVALCLWHTGRNRGKSCSLLDSRSPVLYGPYFCRRSACNRRPETCQSSSALSFGSRAHADVTQVHFDRSVDLIR